MKNIIHILTKPKTIVTLIVCLAIAIGGVKIYRAINVWKHQQKILEQMVSRLSAESRAAEVLVTKSVYNEQSKTITTTIKFLEYSATRTALPAKYFTFEGNVIQFQALVIRFVDKFVKAGDKLKGKSAYLFLKVFVLNGEETQVFDLTKTYEVPKGYQVGKEASEFEKEMWNQFWAYALDPKAREKAGIKNAQIEAPGSMFLPGTIYTIKIEHDGGLRIDTQPIPEILKGESIDSVLLNGLDSRA